MLLANVPLPKNSSIALAGVFFLFLLDVVCKWFVLTYPTPVIPDRFFQFAYFANAGIAFSIPLARMVTLGITSILLVILCILFLRAERPALRIALFSVFLGAFSNFFDRIFTGFTTDYLIFFSYSALNIADILIVAGMLVCAWYYAS